MSLHQHPIVRARCRFAVVCHALLHLEKFALAISVIKTLPNYKKIHHSHSVNMPNLYVVKILTYRITGSRNILVSYLLRFIQVNTVCGIYISFSF